MASMHAARFDRASRNLAVPGEAVGLWGIGGLGVHAVQIARMVGATPIIAVDPTMPLEDVARGVRQLVTKEGNPIRLVVTP
jgi:D-arabinose 1-dehydrogenase-like Zn-dependent alcohol dehydrogenase